MAKNRNEVASTNVADTLSGTVDGTVEALSGEVIVTEKIAPVGERKHRATFASDNMQGGYMIRVEGDNADKFARREVPVTKYNGDETIEKCDKLIWTGPDAETGKKIALYRFVKKPRAVKSDAPAF